MTSTQLAETPAYKLTRKYDPETSHQAGESLDVSAMELIVYQTIVSFGEDGCISDQVQAMLPAYGYSTVTARYKQLKEKGLVVVDDRKRKGKSGRNQLVMWAKKHYKAEE